MKAIIKNELRKYFYSPLGYIVIGVFLVLFSLYIVSGIITYGILDMGIAFFFTAELGLPVMICLLAMGIFAEERKNGTDKILLTAPISTFKMVLAKFLAAGMVIGIGLLFTMVYFFVMRTYGTYSFIEALTQMIGFLLISLAGISFGMFASSLVDNPVIAGALIIIPMLFWSTVGTNFGVENTIFSITHLSNLYINFARGIISIADVLILCLFIALFFALTMIVFKRRRLVK